MNLISLQSTKTLLWVLLLGGVLGLSLSFIQRRFDLAPSTVQIWLGVIGAVLLLISIPAIIRFYIQFGKELSDSNHE